MSSIVDIHSHILPGIDDGARDLDESLDMLRLAAADGTQMIVATPHADLTRPSDIENAVIELNLSAARSNIPIIVLPGNEVKLTPHTAAQYRSGEIVGINNTHYVLTELSFQTDWNDGLFRAFQDLQLSGAWPILAHPERYRAVQRDPRALLRLIEMNVLLQVNAGSLVGEAGDTPKRVAEQLARAGILHLLASDAHGAKSRRPEVRQAHERLADLVGIDYVEYVKTSARRIAEGVHVAPRDYQPQFLDRPQFAQSLWGMFRRN